LADISEVGITYHSGKRWRSYKFELGIGIAIILFYAFILNYKHDSASAEWDYVEDMLLPADFTHKDPLVWRWTNSPIVSVADGSPREIAAVKGAVSELNQFLSDTTFQIQYSDDVSQGNIIFSFPLRAETEKYSDLHPMLKKPQSFEGFWLGGRPWAGRLGNSTIIVFSDLSEGEKWGAVLHELGHSLGLVGHTDRYISSLFYNNWKGGAVSDGFSSDDRKVLQFLYSHLESGYSLRETRDLFNKHWEFRSD